MALSGESGIDNGGDCAGLPGGCALEWRDGRRGVWCGSGSRRGGEEGIGVVAVRFVLVFVAVAISVFIFIFGGGGYRGREQNSRNGSLVLLDLYKHRT